MNLYLYIIMSSKCFFCKQIHHKTILPYIPYKLYSVTVRESHEKETILANRASTQSILFSLNNDIDLWRPLSSVHTEGEFQPVSSNKRQLCIRSINCAQEFFDRKIHSVIFFEKPPQLVNP